MGKKLLERFKEIIENTPMAVSSRVNAMEYYRRMEKEISGEASDNDILQSFQAVKSVVSTQGVLSRADHIANEKRLGEVKEALHEFLKNREVTTATTHS